MLPKLFVFSALAIPFVSAQVTEWGQCGGQGWTGQTTCAAGSVCTEQNEWFSRVASATTTAETVSSSTQSTSATASSSTSVPSAPAMTGFVKTSGQKFVLNGKGYVVAGTNAYWLAQMNDEDIETAFDDIVNSGLTTVRTMGFNDVTTPQEFGAYYQLWTNGTATFNTGDFGISRFDAVVASARAHGIRLVVALTNNWSDYGGMDIYVSQLNPGGTHDTFYTNSKIIAAYKNYVKEFVSRYLNEPAIMGWELANEPRCAGSTGSPSAACDVNGSTIKAWASTISQYVKTIDSNHLVGLGDEGWFQEANPPTYPYAPGLGINFTSNLEIESLDFGTFHQYPESWGQAANASLWGVQWITDHAAAQKNANKPVLLEEFGVINADKATTYTAWWNEVISSGLTGDLIWQAGSYLSIGPSWDDGYAVYPNSTVYPIQQSAAAALKGRG